MASICGVYKSHNNAVCPLCIGANEGYTCCNGTVVETELSTGETLHFHKPVPENDLFRFDPVWMGSRSGVMMRNEHALKFGDAAWEMEYDFIHNYDRLKVMDPWDFRLTAEDLERKARALTFGFGHIGTFFTEFSSDEPLDSDEEEEFQEFCEMLTESEAPVHTDTSKLHYRQSCSVPIDEGAQSLQPMCQGLSGQCNKDAKRFCPTCRSKLCYACDVASHGCFVNPDARVKKSVSFSDPLEIPATPAAPPSVAPYRPKRPSRTAPPPPAPTVDDQSVSISLVENLQLQESSSDSMETQENSSETIEKEASEGSSSTSSSSGVISPASLIPPNKSPVKPLLPSKPTLLTLIRLGPQNVVVRKNVVSDAKATNPKPAPPRKPTLLRMERPNIETLKLKANSNDENDDFAPKVSRVRQVPIFSTTFASNEVIRERLNSESEKISRLRAESNGTSAKAISAKFKLKAMEARIAERTEIGDAKVILQNQPAEVK